MLLILLYVAISTEENMTDSPKDMDDSKLGDLDIQGLEYAYKQNIPILEPQLRIFKRAIIKDRTNQGKTIKSNGKDPSLGITRNGRKELKRQH